MPEGELTGPAFRARSCRGQRLAGRVGRVCGKGGRSGTPRVQTRLRPGASKGICRSEVFRLVMGDGDLTYDLTRIPDLVQPILQGKADFVIGNRMDNMRPGSMPAINRHIGNPF